MLLKVEKLSGKRLFGGCFFLQKEKFYANKLPELDLLMERVMKLPKALVCIFVFLSGCSFQGESSGNQQLAQSNKAELYRIISDNVTTKSDARHYLGDPQDVDYNDNTKQEKWTYLHIDKSNLMRNYIPILNWFSRGTEDVQKKILLFFNENGTLSKSIVTESVGKHKNGLLD